MIPDITHERQLIKAHGASLIGWNPDLVIQCPNIDAIVVLKRELKMLGWGYLYEAEDEINFLYHFRRAVETVPFELTDKKVIREPKLQIFIALIIIVTSIIGAIATKGSMNFSWINICCYSIIICLVAWRASLKTELKSNIITISDLFKKVTIAPQDVRQFGINEKSFGVGHQYESLYFILKDDSLIKTPAAWFPTLREAKEEIIRRYKLHYTTTRI